MVFNDNKFLLPTVVFLFVGQEIRRIGLFLHQVAAVFLVAYHSQNDRVAPFLNTHWVNTFFPKLTGDDVRSFALVDELMKD